MKIIGHGNSSNNWNSLTEVEIWGNGATYREEVVNVTLAVSEDTYIRGGSYSAVTWDNAPIINNLIASTTGGYSVGTATSYDVTELINAQINAGASNVSFMVRSVGPDASFAYYRLASSGNTTSEYHPTLKVTYTTTDTNTYTSKSTESILTRCFLMCKYSKYSYILD